MTQKRTSKKGEKMAKRTIKGLRNDLGLTQEEMAKKLKIANGTFIRYENYQSKIPYEIALAIADLCKIDNLRDIKFCR